MNTYANINVFIYVYICIYVSAIEDIIVDKNVMEVHVTVCTCMNADINMYIYENTHAHMNVYLSTFMYVPAIEDIIADKNVMEVHVTEQHHNDKLQPDGHLERESVRVCVCAYVCV